jgi:DNA-binding transcriptional LysR family regulator
LLQTAQRVYEMVVNTLPELGNCSAAQDLRTAAGLIVRVCKLFGGPMGGGIHVKSWLLVAVERTLLIYPKVGNSQNSSLALHKLQHQPKMHTMQLQIDDVALFARVAELGTLSAAARERDVPVSQVTRSLARLEAACGVRLLHRTTHGLSLTDEGDTFLSYGRRLLDTTAELDSELTGKVSGPSGWVRISASPIMAECVVAPSLCGLYQRYPQLHLDISADDRFADMARDGIDIAIRSGTPNSETVVARQIGVHGRILCASPDYLRAFGTPQHPQELDQHRLIASSASPTLNRWTLGDPNGPADVQVKGHTRTDNTALLLSMVLHGVGIARINDLYALPLIKDGRLVPILQDHFVSPPIPIYAVMLQERHRLPKIRACIDYWAHWLSSIDKS